MPKQPLIQLETVDFGTAQTTGAGIAAGQVVLGFSGKPDDLCDAAREIRAQVNGIEYRIEPGEDGSSRLKLIHSCITHKEDTKHLARFMMVDVAISMLRESAKVVDVDLGMEVIPQPLSYEEKWFPGALIKMRDKATAIYPPTPDFREVVAATMLEKLDSGKAQLTQAKIRNLEEGLHTENQFPGPDGNPMPEFYVTTWFMQEVECIGMNDAMVKSLYVASEVAAVAHCQQGLGIIR